MLRLFSVAVVASALLASGIGSAEDQRQVRIQAFAYEPVTIRVKARTVVEWVNQDEEPHTVTSDDGAFRSRALEEGERFAFTFERKGTFTYHCALHPRMTGTVVVE